MPENQRDKNLKYVHPFNCVPSSQFNTIKLTEKSRTNKCPHCLKSFTKPSGLKAHIFSHTGEKPHKCPVAECGRYFSLLSNLRRHMKIHTKENTKKQPCQAKKSVPAFRPLLPNAPSIVNQYENSASQSNQGQQCHSSHGLASNDDHAYFRWDSVTSVDLSSLPVTPSEDFIFADEGSSCDKSLVNHTPATSLGPTSSLYLPSDDLQLQTTQISFEENAANTFQTPIVPVFPANAEHPPWSAMLSNDPQLSGEELNYLQNLDNQLLAQQQSIQPQDFFLERGFFIFK